MHWTIRPFLVPFLVLALGAACSGCAKDYSKYAGLYLNESRGMYTDALVVVQGNEGYVRLSGGHVVESQPTDMYGGPCEIEAYGYFDGDKYLGAMVPNEDMEHIPQDRMIAILFGDGWLDVKGYDSAGYCGYYMRMHGVYTKYTAQQIRDIYTKEGITIPDELKE